MDGDPQLTEFGKLFIYIIVGTLLVVFTLLIGRFISPHKKNALKTSTYECGEETQGTSWVQFNNRFYVIALIFLLFDVEVVFIFPWATVFGQESLIAVDARWGYFTLIEMFTFVGILVLGLVYVWKKGDLEWVGTRSIVRPVPSPIPSSAYDNINAEVYRVRDYKGEQQIAIQETKKEDGQEARKPAFRPRFVKQSKNE
ncbi:NADH-quinone oxidoreductase subunit A [Olivibacter sitiensis]|uniref:NADH-quinone oxidoreductase subunit A n=1 Tax=Olivibacter sitiensis TaxID=376470 RepID=UPI000428001F|nr:NADH-quinone oxidoreductase subunit A [Olivibacter sitiensis]